MAKPEADSLKKLRISWLRQQGYLDGVKSGVITWTNSWFGNKSSIGIAVNNWKDGQEYIRLSYIQTDTNGQRQDFDYNIQLTTTPCQYGGQRYWFVCPLVVEGKPCRRRVGVLYKLGDYFGCRHCNNLTYDCRNLSGLSKLAGSIISLPELEEMRKEIKRTHYGGKMTKKYQRYLMKQHKSHDQLYTMVIGLEQGLQKAKNLMGRGK